MSIGKNIQTLRKQNNLAQDQLAQKCNVSRQTISRWECDEVLPDTNNLITLSKLFNKSLDEIVFDKKNETNEKPTKKFYKPLLIIVLIISLLINSITFINYLSTKKNSIYGTWTYQEDGFDITLIIKETEEIKPTYSVIEKHPNQYSDIKVYKYYITENANIRQEYDAKLIEHNLQDEKEAGIKYRIPGQKDELYYDQKTNTMIFKCERFFGKVEFKLEKIK